MTSVHTFDDRYQIIVQPGEIKPGDWLRDLGTLRQVQYVDGLSITGSGVLYIIHFVDQPDVANFALGISSSTTALTVWREP